MYMLTACNYYYHINIAAVAVADNADIQNSRGVLTGNDSQLDVSIMILEKKRLIQSMQQLKNTSWKCSVIQFGRE